MKPQEYLKAIVGGALAGLAVLGTALTDGVVSPADWVAVSVATLTVFSGVFGIPNSAQKDVVTQHVLTVTKQDVGPEHRDDGATGKILDGL